MSDFESGGIYGSPQSSSGALAAAAPQSNVLFAFEKMALRDAVKTSEGARLFATGLYDFLHGRGNAGRKFEKWCGVVARLPRKQTRVLTWPVVTIFGFLAQPERHIFLK